MKINYHEILNCECEIRDNTAIIFAPEYTDVNLLKHYNFIQLLDGRWCKNASNTEFRYIMENMHTGIVSVNFTDSVENEKELRRLHNSSVPNILCILSLFLAVMGGVCIFVYEAAVPYLFIAALVTAVAVKVIYPKNIFSLILLIVYAVLLFVCIVAVIVLTIACAIMCDQLLESCKTMGMMYGIFG